MYIYENADDSESSKNNSNETIKPQIAEQYTKLWKKSVDKFRANLFELDPFFNSGSDRRFGITLIIRINEQAASRIQAFLSELRAVEPAQYYYPTSDLHVTVMSVISCYSGFSLEQISVPDYISIITTSLKNIAPFNLDFRGITASASCIMLQGFPENDMLNQFRDSLRENFKQTNLQQTLDKRYAVKLAHSTVVRFRREMTNPGKFIELLEKYRDYDFGAVAVDSYQLVFNDWYLKEKNLKLLHSFTVVGLK